MSSPNDEVGITSRRDRRARLPPFLVFVAAACAACLSSTQTIPPTSSRIVPPSGGSGSPAGSGTFAPVTPAPTPVPTEAASCLERTLPSLTEAQRIGQLFMLGLADDRLDAAELAAIASDHFGSVWFTAQSAAGVGAIRAVAGAVQAQATQATTAGLRFFVAANQEGGLIQALAGPGLGTIPAALELGTRPPSALQASAAYWGGQLRAAGVNLDFAPVADVVPPGTDAQNAPIGQLRREFGHDPATVTATWWPSSAAWRRLASRPLRSISRGSGECAATPTSPAPWSMTPRG